MVPKVGALGEGLNMKKVEALMSFQTMESPFGGVEPERVIKSAESDVIIRLRPDSLHEPPRADPHAGWCGGWGLKSPGYPIMRFHALISVIFQPF